MLEAPAWCQSASGTEQQQALQEALRARDAAAEALRSASDALKKANEAITILRDAGAKPPVTPQLASQEALPTQTGSGPVPRPPRMPKCDAPGDAGSIGRYVVTMNGGRQKKETSYDKNENGTNEGINAFVYHCLGMTKATDYESITNLSAQFTGTRGSDQIEAVVTRTARAVRQFERNGETRLAATYNKYSLGGFGRSGSSNEAPLIDLTESNFASGVGVLAGFEWGRMASKGQADVIKDVHAGVAKARQECLAAKLVDDPLVEPAVGDRPRWALNLSVCEGDALASWMSDKKRRNRYWSEMVSPLWGYGGTPESFAGFQFRYAFQEVKFRPVLDPNTRAVITRTLPPEQKISPEPYSIKLYGGFNRALEPGKVAVGTWGLAGSLTYRREIDFVQGTTGKTICTPATDGATFDICSSDQKLASPYDTKGFVAGVALNLQSKRFWYLPPIAVSPRLTYAFDTERLGFELPLFLLTDADGKLNSGVKYTCRFRGETPEGFELKKTCSINLFVGTSFQLGSAP